MRAMKYVYFWKFAVFFCAIFVFGNSVFASGKISCEKKLVIAYANGIMNTQSDRVRGKSALSSMIGLSNKGAPVEYVLSENPTEGFLSDLARVLKQKTTEIPGLSWDLLVRYILQTNPSVPPAIAKSIDAIIDAIRKEKTAALKKQFEAENNYIDKNVSQHVAMYKKLIMDEGKSVLIVGHSQGNLYANAGHKQFYAQTHLKNRSLGVVGVASPANYVAGGGEYITSTSDMVISMLRLFVSPYTLPGNIDLPFKVTEPMGHSFVGVYVDPESHSYTSIKKMTQTGLDRLGHPNKAGAILARYRAVSWKMAALQPGMEASCNSQVADGIWPLSWVNTARTFYLKAPYDAAKSYVFVDAEGRSIDQAGLDPYLPEGMSGWLALQNSGAFDRSLTWIGPAELYKEGLCSVSEGPPDTSKFSLLDYFNSPDKEALAAGGITLSGLPTTLPFVSLRADVCTKEAITM
ncbi:hypothetical protein [Paraburkholderia hayleyella]|uniref:hypothetical protein n=1 Tax=Paraburkholderia hayleyella TaxID=2152889 RepID=UPI001291AB9C|nr:hypothetical protein [Paraburkholderia hayleyella]